ncbi:MAG TPA: hypothetical protein DCL73_15890 [Treponema sp.]|nr:hypothetical protein [Treponema sp.]
MNEISIVITVFLPQMTNSGNNLLNTAVGKRAAEPKISPRTTLAAASRSKAGLFLAGANFFPINAISMLLPEDRHEKF